MRNPDEFMAQLDAAAAANQKSGIVLSDAILVVAFEDSAILARSTSADRLAELCLALASGGVPIGMIFDQQVTDGFVIATQPLEISVPKNGLASTWKR